MFAKNNQISGRQAMRLLTFDLLGYSALLIPAVLAKEVGRDGIFSILAGIAGGLLFLLLLRSVMSQMSGNYNEYLTKCCGSFLGSILKVCYILYFLLLAGRVASVFAELVVKELLEEQFRLILFIILFLTYYGVTGGIEGRARVYEILFWIVLLPLFGMMLLALPAVDTDYWMPVFYSSPTEILTGGYQVFLCFSILFLIPFFAEYVKNREHLYLCGKKALFLTGMILCLLYLVLLGMFGSNALATLEYPAVTMMSRVQMTGGFFKRADAFMFGIWFFTLYALLNSLVFFGGRLWMDLLKPFGKKMTEKGWARFCMLLEIAFVFYLADRFYQSVELKASYERFFAYVGTPFVVLVPFVLWLIQRVKKAEGK